MKKVFKAPIILSLLAASAFSIIGQEPARAGNTVVGRYGKCRLMRIKEGVLKVKKGVNLRSKLLYEASNIKDGRAFMRSDPKCQN